VVLDLARAPGTGRRRLAVDGGVHFADLFRYHVGPVESLFSEVRGFYPYRFAEREGQESEKIQVDVEDTTLAEMRFAGDVTGTWISTTAGAGLGLQTTARSTARRGAWSGERG